MHKKKERKFLIRRIQKFLTFKVRVLAVVGLLSYFQLVKHTLLLFCACDDFQIHLDQNDKIRATPSKQSTK